MVIRFFLLLLAIPIFAGAQSSWTIVTDGFPLSDRFRKSDGNIRADRLFRLDDQVVLSVRYSGGTDMISSRDGLTWDIFPEASAANRFDVSSRLQTRRVFSSLDPWADLRLQIPVGRTSRLEVTYRDSAGTFLAKGYPGESFEIPSPNAIKISDETAQSLEITEAIFINYPDLPRGEITNLGVVGETIIAQIGRDLYSWCADCGQTSLKGHWRFLSSQFTSITKPQKMAGGNTRGFILDLLRESSVTEVRENTFGAWQSVGAASNDRLNDIISNSDTFMIVGVGYDFRTNTYAGLVVRKIGMEEWETISVPGSREFLSISHGSLGWLATTIEGNIWASRDGTEWSIVGNSPIPLFRLVEVDGHWIATTEQGAVYSSSDLSTWNQQLDPVTGNRGIVGIGSHFLSLGRTVLRRSPLAPEGAPDIISHPVSQAILANETASLTVNPVGEDLTYQWFIGESGDRTNPIANSNLATLVISPPHTEQSYWAEVTNLLGQDQSFAAGILIQSQPTIVGQPTGPPTALDLSNGGYGVPVSATGNGLTYQWYLGQPGDLSNPIHDQTERSLSFRANQPGTRTYFVRVSNRLGFVDSDAVSLTVNPILPVLTSQPESVEATAGDFVKLTVSATGPLLNYQWYQGESGDISQPIPEANSRFFYPETNVESGRSYWVRVSNPAGNIDSSVAIISLNYDNPEVSLSSSKDRTRLVGIGTLLIANITNAVGIRYQWFRGNSGDTSSPVAGANRWSFRAPGDEPGTVTYWVQASNPAGAAASEDVSITYIAPDYQEWADYYRLEEEVSAPEASAAGDKVTNLFRYLARLSPFADASTAFNKPQLYRDPETGEDYLAISLRTRPLPEGTILLVEQSLSLIFQGNPAVEVGTPIINSDQTISRLFRTSQPVTEPSKQFLRVRVISSE